MKKGTLVLSALVLLTVTAFLQAAELRIRPHRLNPNGKRARMKAVILEVDTSTVDTASITLNGIAPIRTHVTDKKVKAFFLKKDVVATLGDVEKGQTHTLTLSFNAAAQPNNLTDDIIIVGKKKSKP
ncbi:hypothetical protein L0222_00745 [bacterium]|nr:hypothetical protein [bacterium]